MWLGEVLTRTGLTRKALLGYEELGLIRPDRDSKGYRLYSERDIELASEIRLLNNMGIPLTAMRPFADCYNAGSPYVDACPATLVEYRRAIERIDHTVDTLAGRRKSLVRNLSAATARLLPALERADAVNPDLVPLPRDLPRPVDDGATDHLPGRQLPGIELVSTDGESIDLGALGSGRTLIYVFPMTGSPDHDIPDGWDDIPGARGCSPQNCDIRDHYADLLNVGIDRVYGLSSQPIAYQKRLVEALHLPYPLLTDDAFRLAANPGLPVLSAGDLSVYRRQSLIVRGSTIEHVFYPVFPPDRHARTVLEWLRSHPRHTDSTETAAH